MCIYLDLWYVLEGFILVLFFNRFDVGIFGTMGVGLGFVIVVVVVVKDRNLG